MLYKHSSANICRGIFRLFIAASFVAENRVPVTTTDHYSISWLSISFGTCGVSHLRFGSRSFQPNKKKNQKIYTIKPVDGAKTKRKCYTHATNPHRIQLHKFEKVISLTVIVRCETYAAAGFFRRFIICILLGYFPFNGKLIVCWLLFIFFERLEKRRERKQGRSQTPKGIQTEFDLRRKPCFMATRTVPYRRRFLSW